MRNVTLAHKRVGAILTKRGQPAEALPHYRTALAADEARLARQPQSAEARYDLSVSLVDLGVTLGATGDWDGQVEQCLRALSMREALMAGDPANARIRGGVRSVLCKLANASVQRGQFDEAQRYVERGRALADEDDPGSTAILDLVMADVEASHGRWDSAVRLTAEALELKSAARRRPQEVRPPTWTPRGRPSATPTRWWGAPSGRRAGPHRPRPTCATRRRTTGTSSPAPLNSRRAVRWWERMPSWSTARARAWTAARSASARWHPPARR